MLTQSNKSKWVSKMTFKRHSRSSEISRFDRVHRISYYHSIVTVAYLVSFPAYSQILVENCEIYTPHVPRFWTCARQVQKNWSQGKLQQLCWKLGWSSSVRQQPYPYTLLPVSLLLITEWGMTQEWTCQLQYHRRRCPRATPDYDICEHVQAAADCTVSRHSVCVIAISRRRLLSWLIWCNMLLGRSLRLNPP